MPAAGETGTTAGPLAPEDITVAVATMGRPEVLASCLAAIARGTVVPGEVIVVDQAPTAASRQVVREAAALRVRQLEHPPRGVSSARNAALAVAAGRVIAYTDDDCEPDGSWLQAIVGAFARPPAPDAVTGRVLPLGPRPPDGFAVSLRSSPVGVDYRGLVLPWRAGTGGNLAIRVDVLRAVGGWDERFGPGSPGRAAEDIELLYRLLKGGSRVRYEPEAAVRHRWQLRRERLASRWSYGYGYGALCGMLLRGQDRFAGRMVVVQARLYVHALLRRVAGRDPAAIGYGRALGGLAVGFVQGLTARSRPG